MRPRKPNLNRFTCKRCKLVLHHNKCLPHFRLVQAFSQCCMREQENGWYLIWIRTSSRYLIFEKTASDSFCRYAFKTGYK